MNKDIKKLQDLGFRISECSIEEIKVAGFKKTLKFTILLEQESKQSEDKIPEKTIERVGNNILEALRILY